MSREWGFAIVGGGVISAWHAEALTGLSNARLRAVVDVVPDVAERRGLEWGIDAYTTLDAALERDDIDVVTVCLPSGLHAEVGMRVAEMGKHLVVEKPIEVTLEAADRLIAACERAGIGLGVISQHRYDPGVVRLRQAVEAGRLGQLILGEAAVKWYRTEQYYRSAGWRGTRSMDGGGSLMNQGIHYVDLLLWIMGPVRRVFARCATAAHRLEVEDVAVAVLEFESGAMGTITASTAVYPGMPERLEITGTGGTVVVEVGQVRAWELKDEKGETSAYGRKLRWSRVGAESPADRACAHRTQLAEVLAALESGRPPPVHAAEARRSLELILAVYESARLGSDVELPLRTTA